MPIQETGLFAAFSVPSAIRFADNPIVASIETTTFDTHIVAFFLKIDANATNTEIYNENINASTPREANISLRKHKRIFRIGIFLFVSDTYH